MHVVQDRVLNPGRGQDARHMGLPHPFGQPHAARRRAEMLFAERIHPDDLPDSIAFGHGAQEGLVVPAPHDLDLSPLRKAGKPAHKLRFMSEEPVPKRPRVVQHDPYRRIALEHVDERQIGLPVGIGEDVFKVAHGLMRMTAENQIDAVHDTPRSSAGPGRKRRNTPEAWPGSRARGHVPPVFII